MDVSLFQNGHYLGGGIIRNINLEGVFVETAVSLSKNALLEIGCLPSNDCAPPSHRHIAIVVHNTPEGLGLHIDTEATVTKQGIGLVYSEHARLPVS